MIIGPSDSGALRTEIAAAVAARTPVDAREAAAQTRFLDALATLADPFDREADLTHVTGSAVVVGARGVVLLLHKKLGIWLQPGGHLDPGEHPADAAIREATEETGLALRHRHAGGGTTAGTRPAIVHLDVHEASAGHIHLDLRYLLDPLDPNADPAPPEGESPHVRWFPWAEAVATADPGLRGFLNSIHPRG